MTTITPGSADKKIDALSLHWFLKFMSVNPDLSSWKNLVRLLKTAVFLWIVLAVFTAPYVLGFIRWFSLWTILFCIFILGSNLDVFVLFYNKELLVFLKMLRAMRLLVEIRKSCIWSLQHRIEFEFFGGKCWKDKPELVLKP